MPLLMVLVGLGAGFLVSVYFASREGVGPFEAPAWLLPIFLLVLFLIFMFYFFENIEIGNGLPVPQRVTAILVVMAAAFGAIYTIGSQNQPLLGLDLQGGVSVVLEPKPTSDKQVTDEALDLTVELLRARIDDIGVAEPEISRQGNNIVVGLPGKVEDQQEALRRLQQTAELRFRPVFLGPEVMGTSELVNQLDQLETDGVDLETLELDDEGNIVDPGADVPDADGDAPADSETQEGSETPADGDAPAGSETPADSEDSEESLTGEPQIVPASLKFQDDDTTETTVDSTEPAEDPTQSTVPEATDDPVSDDPVPETLPDGSLPADDPLIAPDPAPQEQGTISPEQLAAVAACGLGDDGPEGAGLVDGLTPDDADIAEAYVVLEESNGDRYCLGPTLLTGETIDDATVTEFPGQGWLVNPSFLAGEAGIDQFNAAAGACYLGDPDVCPSGLGGSRGRLAVVLDHNVISAPSINSASFERDRIQISGQFGEKGEGARELAEALRFGALPLELEPQETRTVSASIGQDVLQSGVVAGLIGLALVAMYLLAYYRLAGLVAISGLILSAVLLWTIVSWFGEKFGLALSLAGVVGLIVSIGVSTDSNIVYFENVKDAYRSGRRIPTSVERAYESAISTIVKADVVSLIAAILLYMLTVGAVRGFAFYLGLATILDLIISWMFMRPALGWLARRAQVEDNPRMLGLPAEGGAR